MDVESKEENKLMTATADQDKGLKHSRRRKKICCVGSIAFLVTTAIVFLILGLTVFKTKKPVTTVNSIALEDMKVSMDIARLRVNFNVTLNVDLTIKNPNSVGFKYSSSSAFLKFRDQVVGEAPFPAGKIGSHGTAPINVSLTVMADRLLSDTNLYSDVISGTVPFTTYVKLTGKVQFVFKIKVKSYTTCDIDIDVLNTRLARQSCHYKTKL